MKQILLSLTALIAIFQANAQESLQQSIANEQRKLGMALYAAAAFYVDSTSVNKLSEDAIIGMLSKLDPHSSYSDPEETRELNEPLQGNFDGVGIQFNILNDTVYIVQVISGGPSEKVGIQAGDRIILINDTLVAGIKFKNTDVQKRLRGPRGTIVRVSIKRRNIPGLLEYTITRGAIPVYSIDASYMVDEQTGYIRLSRFAAQSANEFRSAFAKLKSQGLKKLILDLQNNGGGYMNIAVDIVNEFLSANKLIVYSEGNHQPRQDDHSTSGGLFETGPLVIMVDEASASASEILAGALQDWDRAVILGRRTFGKGVVQKPFVLPDGSMIRLTVSRYYTPSGRSIQKPYENGNNEQYRHELIDRYNRGELMSADSIHFPDSLKFQTLTAHRTVYGGGGIMPDVFIPVDTTLFSDYHRKLVANGLVNRLAMTYADANRDHLKLFHPDIASFKSFFNVPATLLDDLIAQAEADKIPLDSAQYNRSLPLITLQIKALIARDLFDISEYFEIINEANESYKAAVALINDEQRYHNMLAQRRK
ncbi:MAG: S41 family peptidase [Tannerellaceae bacterium]|jgi:carboxyl-terminal processing protease|nr:S41 family peptidase [Tannerellaceae bacterium]